MSRLTMAAMFFISTVGCSRKCFEPSNPISSAPNAMNKRLRFNEERTVTAFCASSSREAVPLALSSAPLWMAGSPR